MSNADLITIPRSELKEIRERLSALEHRVASHERKFTRTDTRLRDVEDHLTNPVGTFERVALAQNPNVFECKVGARVTFKILQDRLKDCTKTQLGRNVSEIVKEVVSELHGGDLEESIIKAICDGRGDAAPRRDGDNRYYEGLESGTLEEKTRMVLGALDKHLSPKARNFLGSN